jgi:hypothetical protein
MLHFPVIDKHFLNTKEGSLNSARKIKIQLILMQNKVVLIMQQHKFTKK